MNLLNYECHNDTGAFISKMISHCLLPHILHPTRVIDHSATVTDNIFFPITHHMKLLGISNHFPQFIILNHATINYKTCSYAKRNFSTFNEQKFINDLESPGMNFTCDTNISLNSKFGLFFQTLSEHVDCHTPLMKLNKKV